MPEKKKSQVRKELTRTNKNQAAQCPEVSLIQKYLNVARAVWNEAGKSEPSLTICKKKEAIGWALIAARMQAEAAVERGESFEDCLDCVVQELIIYVAKSAQGNKK